MPRSSRLWCGWRLSKRGRPLRRARLQRRLQARGGVVGGADRADLALVDQLGEGAERLLQRHRLVVLVRLVEVDPLHAEAAEARLDGGVDPVGREALALARHLHAALGQDHHLLPAAGAGAQPLADHRFGFAALVAGHPGRIDVGGVDHVEPGIDHRVEQAEAGVPVHRPAEDVAAEDHRRDLDPGSAEAALPHGVPLLLPCRHSGARGGDRPRLRFPSLPPGSKKPAS